MAGAKHTAGFWPQQEERPGARPALPAESVERYRVPKMGFCLQGRDREEGVGRCRQREVGKEDRFP